MFVISVVVHVFETSPDLNAIAAIIPPLDDEIVEGKCRVWGEGLVITKDQKVRLWRGYVRSDWY